MRPFATRLRALLSAPDRLLWAVRVRWLAIVGFLSLAALAHAFGLFESVLPCVLVAVIGGALNAVNGWCVRHRRHVFAVSALAIPMDHVFATYLVVHTGGVQSPFLMLYVVQVVATAMLVDTLVAAGSALLAIGLWIAGVGAFRVAPVFAAGRTPSTGLYQGTWAAFLFYCLALLVYLGGYIAERLRSSEIDLAAQHQRLQEALSSLRVAHAELRAAYERQTQTEAHLVQSEKMRSLGQLVAGVAHELNNPISFVLGNVEHLRSYVDRLRQALETYAAASQSPAERVRLDRAWTELRIDDVLADLPGVLADCEEGARRTKVIVNELRTFSRSDEREHFRLADLHGGIDSTLGLLANRFKDHIVVHRDFGELPGVECVPGQVNQVVMNLLANAADAIDQRPGNIWITTRAVHGGVSGEPAVSVAIRDDGPGMPPDVQAKIFEPFFTTKGPGQGVGLGLSVSYGIVQRHRGLLSVQSAPGAGTTFTFTLPIRQTPSPVPAA